MKVFFIQCTLLVTEVKKLMKNLSENCPFEKKKTKFKSETRFRIYRTEREKNEYRETDILLRICDVVNGNVKLESPWTGWDFVCCSKHGRQSYR